jgi:hypothetical protein
LGQTNSVRAIKAGKKSGPISSLYSKKTGDVRWDKHDIRAIGDKAYAEWRRHATLADGTKQDWLGVDIYTFENGTFLMKDTYIKVVGLAFGMASKFRYQ